MKLIFCTHGPINQDEFVKFCIKVPHCRFVSIFLCVFSISIFLPEYLLAYALISNETWYMYFVGRATLLALIPLNDDHLDYFPTILSSKERPWHAHVACGTISTTVRHLGLCHFHATQARPGPSCVPFPVLTSITCLLCNVTNYSDTMWLMQVLLHRNSPGLAWVPFIIADFSTLI